MSTNKPRQHQNSQIAELRKSADPLLTRKAKKSMQLAAQIEDAMIKRGFNKSSFAQLMGVQPSVVTKWLSGLHNFTVDTLFEIEHKLHINLVLAEEHRHETVLHMTLVVTPDKQVSIPAEHEPWNLVDHTLALRRVPAIRYMSIKSGTPELELLKSRVNAC